MYLPEQDVRDGRADPVPSIAFTGSPGGEEAGKEDDFAGRCDSRLEGKDSQAEVSMPSARQREGQPGKRRLLGLSVNSSDCFNYFDRSTSKTVKSSL